MEEVFEHIEMLAKAEKRVAMATLIATLGTSPKKEGAKLWVGEAGRILGSVTIGGCVDARVIEESEQALARVEPRLLTVALGEEDAWETGFTCAGTVRVMIEPLDFSNADDGLLQRYALIKGEVEAGRCAVMATRLDRPMAKLLLFEDGRASGTLGAAELDKQAQAKAQELMARRHSRTLMIGEDADATEVFFEVHSPTPTLICFGAGPVSMHLVNLAKEMGLRTIVVDGRPRFATRERFPQADALRIGIPSEIAAELSYTSSTFVVLTAHDYKYDLPVLKQVLKTEAAYIGLLGSRRRGQAILQFLAESGIGQPALARVHVPTGLDIGAQTAAEIALSILAEAVAVKSGHIGRSLKEKGNEENAEFRSQNE